MQPMMWNQLHGRRPAPARESGEQARRDGARTARELSALEDRVDRLALVTQTLWELLQEHSSLTEAQLLERIEEIDLRDGKLDGKNEPSAPRCVNCGRKSCRNHTQCMYCGHGIEPSSPF